MSSLVPRVVVTRAWVSPRVKMALPWVRGRIPASIQMSRTSSKARASGRRFFLHHFFAEDAFAQSFEVLLQLRLRCFVIRREFRLAAFS